MITKIFGLVFGIVPGLSAAISAPLISNLSDSLDEFSLSELNLPMPNASLTAGPLPLDIKCSGAHFGWSPSISDCESAKGYIVPDSTQYPWGQRQSGLGDDVFPLPYRIMGGKWSIPLRMVDLC